MRSSIARSAAGFFDTRKRTLTQVLDDNTPARARSLVESANDMPGYTVGEERQKCIPRTISAP